MLCRLKRAAQPVVVILKTFPCKLNSVELGQVTVYVHHVFAWHDAVHLIYFAICISVEGTWLLDAIRIFDSVCTIWY